MAAWPGSLPQRLHISAEETFQQGFIRTEMSTGPYKQRKKFTATSRYLRGSMHLSKAQRTTFDTFYKTTLNEGADEFTWVDPIDHSTGINVRFRSVPTFEAIKGGTNGVELWFVTLDLEILP